jgi:Fe-S cluster assembly protein SufD
MTEITERRNLYVADFERHGKSLPAFPELRRKAIERFASLGFPTTREEAWRFTDVSALSALPSRVAGGTPNPAQFSGLAKGPLRACQIAFVDGRYAPAFSSLELPPGVRVASLAHVLAEEPRRVEPWLARSASFEGNAFAALNTAFMNDGVFIHLSRGAAPPLPFHLLFLSSFHGEPYVTHPRVLVVAEEESKATIVESYLGPAGGVYFTNAVAEAVLGEGAALDFTKVQRESHEAFHVQTLQARQARGSTFTHRSISLGAGFARNDLGTLLEGEGAECTLYGLFEVAGAQLADHHTTIDHARPHGTSRELYKGILDGKGRGVFDGRIVVRPDAQKTSAIQTNQNLLLSKEALVHTKPQLEIFANDVRCKHGATIGQLDEAVLFYLRSRGIGLPEARRLLVHAFAGEIVDTVTNPGVRAQLGGCLGLLAGAGA